MSSARADLERLRRVAAELSAASAVRQADELAERLDEGRFFVACLGQFKRGKSTLLNALLGRRVLPTGVIPVTSAITIVRFGPERRIKVTFERDPPREVTAAELELYVAEQHNPENEKGVVAVEVFEPSELLETGMCLVDTPGIGSIHAGNTDVTRRFVPHVDAALVVLGGDPPISGEELALVEEAAKETPELLFALNKADRLPASDVVEAKAFTTRTLEARLRRANVALYVVSAVEALERRSTRDFEALRASLRALADASKAQLVARAAARGVERIRAALAYELDERRSALLRPREETERHLAYVRACIADAERAMSDIGPLLEAEQKRLAGAIQRQRDTFLAGATPKAHAELEALAEPVAADASLHRRLVHAALGVAHDRIEAWATSLAPESERSYELAVTRFVELAEDVLSRLVDSGEPAFASLPRQLEGKAAFRAPAKFHFHELLTLADEGAAARAISRLRSRDRRKKAALDAVHEYLDRLLETNSARVANDLGERVLASRRALERELRALLVEVVRISEAACERAASTQARGDEAVREELDRLRRLRGELGPT